MLNDELLLPTLRMLRQGAIDKAVGVHRIAAPQNPAGVHPPQTANAHHHCHDLSRLLPFGFSTGNLRPSRKHAPFIQILACGSIHLLSAAKHHLMLISDESV